MSHSSAAPVLRPRAVPVLLAAAGASYAGDEICAVALAISVHDSFHSGPAVAAVVLAALLPRVVLAPVIGRLLDTVETTRLLRATLFLQALLTVALAIVPALPARLALLAAISVGGALTPNALLALAPTVVGRAGTQKLVSMLSTVNRASSVVGPLVGAVLVGSVGAMGALWVDAASFLLLAVAVGALGVRRAPAAPTALEPRTVAGVRRARLTLRSGGFAAIRSDVVLRRVIAVLALAIVPVGISYVATVFYAADVLSAGDLGVGLLMASYGAGMTLGCLACRTVPANRLAPLAVAAPLGMGGGLLLAAVLPMLGVAVVGYTISGFAGGFALTAMRALVVARVPERVLGRVLSAEGAIGATGELLALVIGGALVSAAGPRTALLVAGIGAMVPTLGVVALRVSGRARRDCQPVTVNEPMSSVSLAA